MHAKRPSLLLLLLLLSLAGCGPSRQLALPCQPNVSEAAADRLEEKIRPIVEEQGPEVFTLQTTGDEVTSLLLRMLEEHPGESPVEAPRVCFTPGEVHVAGRIVNVLPATLEGVAVFAPDLVEGRVEIAILRASAGSKPLPRALLRTLSRTINETLAESELSVRFGAVEVGEDQITVSGTRIRGGVLMSSP
jgi:predicted small lipoprotein YifL